MNKNGPRLALCALGAGVLLAGGAFALSQGDSLISLSYLTDTFIPSAQSQMEQQADKTLQEVYDQGKESLTGDSPWLESASLSPKAMGQRDVVTLPTGSGCYLERGSALLSDGGVLIDVTDGSTLSAGAALAPGHRDLAAENSQAKVTITSGKAYLGVEGSYDLAESSQAHLPFVDVAQGQWYQQAVEYVYNNGLFSGMTEEEFGPSVTMSRAMVVTVFYRLAGSPEAELSQSQNQNLADVPAGSWFAPFVNWGYAQGVTAGMGENIFGPNVNVTREQLLVMLRSFAQGYLGKELSGSVELAGYADGSRVSSWAADSVSWAIANGLISPGSGGSIRPGDSASRAEVALILMNFQNLVK